MNWQKLLNFWRQVGLYCCLLLLCCSCVQYRMELSFNWLTGGTIVQNLKWDSNVGNFIGNYSETATEELLAEIERRAAASGGTAEYLSDSEMRVEIPFDNYTQLEEKFNSFFNQPLLLLSQITDAQDKAQRLETLTETNPSRQLAVIRDRTPSTSPRALERSPKTATGNTAATHIPREALTSLATAQTAPNAIQINNTLQGDRMADLIAQSNPDEDFKVTKHGFLVADRYDLTYTLDLTDIRLPVSGSFFTLSVDRLLDLQMALTTPIPASRSNATVRDGNRLEWHLDTGAVNHLSGSFWTPSPLGIALIAAIALSAFVWVWRLDRPRRRG